MKTPKTRERAQSPPNASGLGCADFFNDSRRYKKSLGDNIVTFQFGEEGRAQAFFELLQAMLPLINTPYPQISKAEVHLSDEQYLFYQRQIFHESTRLTTDYLGDSLLKTLRADEYDFSYAFILGIIPGENGIRRHQNLRPKARGLYTITPEREVVQRDLKKAMYTSEDKKGFSQIQSSTLIDPNARSAAFGFSREQRNAKLYGLMTHVDDALINRMLIEDCGTVSRIFDFDSMETAKTYLLYLKDATKTRCYSPDQINQFKAANIKSRKSSSSTNEVLARLRFNPYRSVVSICADTLAARLLAYDFAQELLEHYTRYAESKGVKVNKNFKIPIIFYVPKELEKSRFTKKNIGNTQGEAQHELRFYTQAMRKRDQAVAQAIYTDAARRNESCKDNNYEFLLGLPEITAEILLGNCNGLPLAYVMMRNGFTRMLLRLMRQGDDGKQSLRDEVFDSLIKSRTYFKIGDPIIASLIFSEAFDLADKLILATHSEKEKLDYRSANVMYTPLCDILARSGNPRQLNYMGLEIMLLKAAKCKAWGSVKLCLKEFPHIDKTVIEKLSGLAKAANQLSEALFLMSMSEESSKVGVELIGEAWRKNDWRLVSTMAQNPRMAVDKSTYGYILMKAMIAKQEEAARHLLEAGADPLWRLIIAEHDFESPLYYALRHGFRALIPGLVKHEKQAQDDHASIRYVMALDLAEEQGDREVIALLESDWVVDTETVVDPNNIKQSICRVFLQSLSLKSRSMAEKCLIQNCHQFDLLPSDNHSIIDGFRIIMEHFYDAVNALPTEFFSRIIKYCVGIFFKCEALDLIAFVVNPSAYVGYFFRQGPLESTAFKTMIAQMNANNVHFIKSVINRLESPLDEEKCHELHTKWERVLFMCLQEAICNDAYDGAKAILLLDLGIRLTWPDPSLVLERALSHDDLNLARMILQSYTHEGDVPDSLLSVVLAHKVYIPALYSFLENNVTPRQVKEFSQKFGFLHDDLTLMLLDAIDQENNCNKNNLWDFYFLFTNQALRTNTSFKIEMQLMTMLSPAMIKHMTLIFLLDQFLSSNLLKNPTPNILNFIAKKTILGKLCYKLEVDDKLNATHLEIINIFEGYFTDVDIIPEDTTIIETYAKILELFKRTEILRAMSLRFFKSNKPQPSKYPEFNSALYLTMIKVDDELTMIEKTFQADAKSQNPVKTCTSLPSLITVGVN
jgi:hypothetical protein